MIVVADTSPLDYLILIGMEGVLPALFREVLIPPGVAFELGHLHAPAVVKAWITTPPDWLRIMAASSSATIGALNPGESQAITLAQDVHADRVLIDERPGREEALRRGLFVTGRLGVLSAASKSGLIDAREAVERLRRTTFRVKDAQLRSLLEQG